MARHPRRQAGPRPGFGKLHETCTGTRTVATTGATNSCWQAKRSSLRIRRKKHAASIPASWNGFSDSRLDGPSYERPHQKARKTGQLRSAPDCGMDRAEIDGSPQAMADAVETPAESSSAAEAPSAPKADDIGSMAVPTDPEDYAEWRATGKLPEKGRKPSKEDSATSKSSVDEESSESAPVSETGTQAGKRSAEKRIGQLTKEREDFRRELESLKAQIAGKQDAKPPESSSAPAPSEASDRPRKPKQEEYKTWEEYESAQDAYLENLADWKAGTKIE